jgi:hypothetical protein
MKKILFLTVITLLTLSSCKKEDAAPTQTQTFAKSQPQPVLGNASSDNAAVPFRDTFTVNWDGTQIYDSCTAELITLYGTEVIIAHGVYNGNMSKITFNVHFQNGFRGIGESGRRYVMGESLMYQESYFSDGVFSAKLKASSHILTEGGGNNLTHTETFYYKVDAEGTVTVVKDPVLENYCQ